MLWLPELHAELIKKKEETMGGICTIWDYGGKATFDMHSVIHFKMLCFNHSHKLLNDVLNKKNLWFQTDIQLNMALRRSQRNAEKPSDELEPMNLESEPMTIEVEEVQMLVESKKDKETQPSKKKKIIGPNTDKQQKYQKYQQAASAYHAGKFKTIR